MSLEKYSNLVTYVLNRHFRSGYHAFDRDELEQVGMIGLWKALKHVDNEKDEVLQKAYLKKCIKGSIYKFIEKEQRHTPEREVNDDTDSIVTEQSLMAEYANRVMLDDKWSIIEILTDKEYRLLDYVMKGYKGIDIAKELDVSPQVVNRRKQAVIAKIKDFYEKNGQ